MDFEAVMDNLCAPLSLQNTKVSSIPHKQK